MVLFFFCLDPKTPTTPSSDTVEDVFKAAQDDRRHETSRPATTEMTKSEMKENKEKLIQKEGMETGSVSFYLVLQNILRE